MAASGRSTRRDVGHGPSDAPEDGTGGPQGSRTAQRPLLEDVDGLLDEIDQVLEVNAEEFVRGYVQKGGQ
jgi:prokaryotic ubiquitin-like protein Pup